MAVNLEERVDSLETILGQFISRTGAALLRMERDTERLKKEMQEFKNEMREFKREMQEFKEESRRENIKMNQRMGQLANKLGVVTESLVYPSIRRIIREWFDLEAETIMVGVERQLKDGSFKEFDVLAIAEEYAFWVSTKTTLRNQYVNEFVKEIPDFRKFFPEYQDKKLIGILAALVINKAQLRYAERKGFLVIGIGEEIMEVKNSKGFKPKIW